MLQGRKAALAWWQREGHGRVVCCVIESHVACAHDEWLGGEKCMRCSKGCGSTCTFASGRRCTMCRLASRSATCTFPGHWYIACSGCKVLASLVLLFLHSFHVDLSLSCLQLADLRSTALLAHRSHPTMLAVPWLSIPDSRYRMRFLSYLDIYFPWSAPTWPQTCPRLTLHAGLQITFAGGSAQR